LSGVISIAFFEISIEPGLATHHGLGQNAQNFGHLVYREADVTSPGEGSLSAYEEHTLTGRAVRR
jgi:hypothetical protein